MVAGVETLLNDPSKAGGRRCVEKQGPHWNFNVEALSKPGDDLDGEQRMPTEFEEIIGNADTIYPEAPP